MQRDLKVRTKRYAIDCWTLCLHIPTSREFDAWARQLIKCSGSVGANYRAAQRAKSPADFINKLKIAEEEADESVYWLEMLNEVSALNNPEIKRLIKEGNELLAILVTSIKTPRKKR